VRLGAAALMAGARQQTVWLQGLEGALDSLAAVVAGDDESTREAMEPVVAHLVSTESRFFRQTRRMVEEEHPDLDFAPVGEVEVLSLDEAVAAFEAIRVEHLDYLTALEPEDWSRGGIVTGLGEVTILSTVQYMIAHDAKHLAQVARIRLSRGGRR
jgi:uncharacterized damage-inducible protein DinB